ncbi:MAG: hypothetical protein ACLFTE_08900 [Salinivenus sp.]
MSTQSHLFHARRVFLSPGDLEAEPDFRRTLTRRMGVGLQWGGLVGLLGVAILVGVHWDLLARPTTWWDPTPHDRRRVRAL